METNRDIMADLLKKAESGKHRQFQFLQNSFEYSKARKIRRAERLLVASIRKSAKKLFKKYCKTIPSGEADMFILMAYCTTAKMLGFYEEELNILSDMIHEYEVYLATGNLLDFVFGFQRPIDKLYDHRG